MAKFDYESLMADDGGAASAPVTAKKFDYASLMADEPSTVTPPVEQAAPTPKKQFDYSTVMEDVEAAPTPPVDTSTLDNFVKRTDPKGAFKMPVKQATPPPEGETADQAYSRQLNQARADMMRYPRGSDEFFKANRRYDQMRGMKGDITLAGQTQSNLETGADILKKYAIAGEGLASGATFGISDMMYRRIKDATGVSLSPESTDEQIASGLSRFVGGVVAQQGLMRGLLALAKAKDMSMLGAFALTRLGGNAVSAGARSLTSWAAGNTTAKESARDFLLNYGSSIVSMIPENALPAGAKNAVAQIATDFLVDLVADGAIRKRMKDQSFASWFFKEELPSLVMSVAAAGEDLRNPGQLKLQQNMLRNLKDKAVRDAKYYTPENKASGQPAEQSIDPAIASTVEGVPHGPVRVDESILPGAAGYRSAEQRALDMVRAQQGTPGQLAAQEGQVLARNLVGGEGVAKPSPANVPMSQTISPAVEGALDREVRLAQMANQRAGTIDRLKDNAVFDAEGRDGVERVRAFNEKYGRTQAGEPPQPPPPGGFTPSSQRGQPAPLTSFDQLDPARFQATQPPVAEAARTTAPVAAPEAKPQAPAKQVDPRIAKAQTFFNDKLVAASNEGRAGNAWKIPKKDADGNFIYDSTGKMEFVTTGALYPEGWNGFRKNQLKQAIKNVVKGKKLTAGQEKTLNEAVAYEDSLRSNDEADYRQYLAEQSDELAATVEGARGAPQEVDMAGAQPKPTSPIRGTDPRTGQTEFLGQEEGGFRLTGQQGTDQQRVLAERDAQQAAAREAEARQGTLGVEQPVAPRVGSVDVNDGRLYGEGQLTYTGRPAQTKGPIEVIYTSDGRLLVEDGWHRIQDAKQRGDKTIPANIVNESGEPVDASGRIVSAPDLATMKMPELKAAALTAGVDPSGSAETIRGRITAANRIRGVIDGVEQAARADLDQLRRGGTMGMNKPIGIAADYVIIGAAKVARGMVDFAEWSKSMLDEFGEDIRPRLRGIWDASNRIHMIAMKNGGDSDVSELIANSSKIEAGKLVASEAAATPKGPGEVGPVMPRKIIDRAQKAPGLPADLKTKLAAIDPQDYRQYATTKEYAVVKDWMLTDPTARQAAESVVYSDDKPSASKTILAAALIDRYRAEGDSDAEVRLLDHHDKELRAAGRFIQAASLMYRASGKAWVSMFNKYMDKRWQTLPPNVMSEINEKFHKAAALSDGDAKNEAMADAVNFAASHVRMKTGDWFDAYRYFNMMSNPQMHLRNAYFNTMMTAIGRPLALAGQGDVRGIGTYAAEAVKAMPQAMQNAITAFSRLGLDAQGVMESSEGGGKGMFEAARKAQGPSGPVAGKVYRGLTSMQRAMYAADEFFSTVIKAGEYKRLINNNVKPEKALAEAEKLAAEYLVRREPGEDMKDASVNVLSRAIDSAGVLIGHAKKAPAGIGRITGWMVPFLRSPIDWAKMQVEFSPLGYATQQYKRVNSELTEVEMSDEMKGRARIGTIATVVGAAMAQAGMTTWEAPKDPKEREAFYASGRRPYSVLIAGKWVPMWYFGPVALALALPAAAKGVWQDSPEQAGKDWIAKTGRTAGAALEYMFTQSPMAQIAMMFQAITGQGDTKISKAIGFSSGQVAPLSGATRYVNKWVDPTYRKATDAEEVMKRDYTGFVESWQKELPAYTDANGKETQRPLSDKVLPFTLGTKDKEGEAKYQERRAFMYNRGLNNNKFDQMFRSVRRGKVKESELSDFIDAQDKDERSRLLSKVKDRDEDMYWRISGKIPNLKQAALKEALKGK